MSNVPEVTGARSSRQKTRKTSKWSSTWIYLLALLLGWCVITWYFSFSVHKSSTSNRNGNEFSNVVVPPRKTPTNVDLQQRKESGSLSSGDQHFLISYLTMTGQFQQEEQSSSDAQKAQEIFSKEMRRVQAWLLQTQKSPFLPLTAYLESPLPPYNDTQVPRLLSTHRLANKPQDLIQREYTTDTPQSCLDLPNAFPVMKPPTDKEEAETQNRKNDCPIHGDPFLPWIHDAFVSPSGTVVEIVAHNQRRCHTNPKQYFHRLQHLEPQVTIMQSVPVIREKATGNGAYRYRLASLQEAAANTDAVTETRFICHFHTQVLANNQEGDTLQTIPLGETLSVFPYNYEHANDRKRNSKPMLTRGCVDDNSVFNALKLYDLCLENTIALAATQEGLAITIVALNNKAHIFHEFCEFRSLQVVQETIYAALVFLPKGVQVMDNSMLQGILFNVYMLRNLNCARAA
ncbi:expressed unknown protein [Seminavis robusta]|uniref:Uncharacterized protein n=1 Tax=Seminavis robusta TaxID=568900 RepID=A0A9N8HV08_9STRA|nr:expressed unknown protein [Seminavis robusta]|eukprot:Sro1910_g304900.1 n/a (459) ;mRNA; f:15979-17522